jgi:undecaprenyl-diphosphatase
MPEWIQQFDHWIQRIDDQVLDWFQGQRTPFFTEHLDNITALGSATVITLAGVFAVGLVLLRRHYLTALMAAVLLVGTHEATWQIKELVPRARPNVARPAKEVRMDSFPSSHASRSMATSLILALCWVRTSRPAPPPWARRYVLAWAVAVALLVGVSRLYRANHFLSDVLVGWLLGAVFALVFAFLSRFTERRAVA